MTTARGIHAPRRARTIGHQAALTTAEVRYLRGLWVTSPVRTFLDLAAMLPLVPLVAVGDRILSRRSPLSSLAEIEAAIDARPGRRGIRMARAALALLDDGAESPKETELRLALRFAGHEGLVTNHELRDRHGRFVARVDLALPHLRIAIEYEGDHHRDKHQWRADIARRRRIEAIGWTYLSVTQADLEAPAALLADLRAAIAARR